MGIAVIKGAFFALGSDCDSVDRAAILERLDVHQLDVRQFQRWASDCYPVRVVSLRFWGALHLRSVTSYAILIDRIYSGLLPCFVHNGQIVRGAAGTFLTLLYHIF